MENWGFRGTTATCIFAYIYIAIICGLSEFLSFFLLSLDMLIEEIRKYYYFKKQNGQKRVTHYKRINMRTGRPNAGGSLACFLLLPSWLYYRCSLDTLFIVNLKCTLSTKILALCVLNSSAGKGKTEKHSHVVCFMLCHYDKTINKSNLWIYYPRYLPYAFDNYTMTYEPFTVPSLIDHHV